MKKKTLRKRLVLSKSTIVNLDAVHFGGLDVDTLFKTACNCPTAGYNCTTRDPNQLCQNGCLPPEPDSSVAYPCAVTDCNC